MSMEWSAQGRRGFIASWPQFGVPVGLLLANLPVLFFSLVSGDNFLVCGWRIPFALSLILVFVRLYIRLGILETPTFQRMLALRRIAKQPVLQVIRRHPKEIL